MKIIPLSQLPDCVSLAGLYTLGTDSNNESVKVPLGDTILDIEKTAQTAKATANTARKEAGQANEAAELAKQAADTVAENLKKTSQSMEAIHVGLSNNITAASNKAAEALSAAQQAQQTADGANTLAEMAQETANQAVTGLAHVNNDWQQGDKLLRENLEEKIKEVAESCAADGDAFETRIQSIETTLPTVKNTANQAAADIADLARRCNVIKFGGIKAPEGAAASPEFIHTLEGQYVYEVYYEPNNEQFYIQLRLEQSDLAIAYYYKWIVPEGYTTKPMEAYGYLQNGYCRPFIGGLYIDPEGRLFVGTEAGQLQLVTHARIDPNNMLTIGTLDKEYVSIGPNATMQTRQATDGSGNAVLTIGQGSFTFSANVSLENIKLKINKQTGILTVTNSAGVSAMSMGIYNTIGSNNIIQSNVNLSDRATLNAHVVSYAANGLLSIRHVIDGSAYSGMEHINMGGYNVMGSNNILKSGIRIGDNVNIPDNFDPANIQASASMISCQVIGEHVHIIGAQPLIDAGYVPYLFRLTKKRNMWHFRDENGEDDHTYGPDLKGWHLFGSAHALSIINNVLNFSQNNHNAWDRPASGYSPNIGALIIPSVDEEGRHKIGYGRTSIIYRWTNPKTGLPTSERMIRLRFAIAFARQGCESTAAVMDSLATPLVEFSAIYDTGRSRWGFGK